MDKEELIKKITEKKEFRELPESLIRKVIELKEIKNLDNEDKIKEARAFLRKYFTVFLTNKIIKGKLSWEELLKKHISSKDRDYNYLYERIFKNWNCKKIIDLGAGLNGLSFEYIKKFSDAKYTGIEASKTLVNIMSKYFKENNYNANAFWEDLFDFEKIKKIAERSESPKIIFLFKVVDALESTERDYSKKILLEMLNKNDRAVVSYSIQSISGKSRLNAKRFWLLNFLDENFSIIDDFEMSGERYIAVEKN